MKFNRVKFRNFLSYGDEEHSLDFLESGVRLVTGTNEKDGGSNGSGKSTAVVDAICYSLFGKTTKRLKADQIVNRIIGRNCKVETTFSVNKNEYRVVRYRLDAEHGNSLYFYKNEEDASGESKTDTQEKIEDTLNLSFKSFVSGVVLSQENVSNFADSDPLERRKIIENLLMYDFISRYHTATKEILRVINPEIKSLETRISDKKDTIQTVTDNLFQYIEQKENEESQRKERISNLEKEYEELTTLDLDTEIKLRREIRELESKLEIDENNLKKLNNDLLNIRSRLESLEFSIKEKDEEINTAKNDPERCPVCYNIIDEESLNKYLEDKTNERNNLLNSKNDLTQQLDTYNNEVAELRDNIKEIKTQLENKKSKCSSDLADKEIENSKVKLTEISSELKYLKENPVDIENDSLISSSTEDLERHKKELKKHRKKLRKLEEEKDYYEWWKIALGNNPSSMKSFCINHVITSFNKYINYYLSFFGYDVTYSLNEELEETIVKDGYEATFGSFSGGEKRALEISLVFALYELIRLKLPDNINMIVLDELLSINFDDVRVSAAIDILTELEERGLSIFVIDHKSTLKDNLECKVINIVKDKHGNSKIETS